MRNVARFGWSAGLAVLVALGLAGCGGNDSLPSKTPISKVYVMGDSLADVGTFGGIKLTVQDPINPKNSLIWTQLIANNFGLDGSAQCNFYSISNAVTTNPNCTNFAEELAEWISNLFAFFFMVKNLESADEEGSIFCENQMMRLFSRNWSWV